jgi:hypothetical protein
MRNSKFQKFLILVFALALAVPLGLRAVPASAAGPGGQDGQGDQDGRGDHSSSGDKGNVVIRSTTYFDSRERVEADRANNAASRYSFRTPTNNLINHYGPVMTGSVNVYLIFWGWAAAGDPSAAQPYINGFYNAASNTSWLKSVTQYSGATNVYAAVPINDTNAVPAKPTSQDIANEAGYWALLKGTGPDNLYLVLTPHGHSESGFATQWCGYHSYAYYINGPTFAYGSVPYQPDAGYSCGSSWGTNAGYSIVGGHELAEAITDVYLNAWYDRNGAENGDKCAWTGIATGIPGYITQPLWSNAFNLGRGGCVQSYP